MNMFMRGLLWRRSLTILAIRRTRRILMSTPTSMPVALAIISAIEHMTMKQSNLRLVRRG